MKIHLRILGVPQPKQSARFSIRKGKAGNNYLHKFQKQEVIDQERNFAFDAKSQLPENFKPYSGPVRVKALFVFPPLKSFSKAKLNILASGGIIYKDTKPDLQDNLFKGVADALEGIVFKNDSQICEVSSRKIYGTVPRVELIFEEL